MSAPAPTIAQLPLPPGYTLESYEKLQDNLTTIAIVIVVGLAIITWDYLVLIRDELQLYMGSNRALWKNPATWAFIVLRYSAFVATIPALYFTTLTTKHCQAAASISQVGAVLVATSAGTIFAYRVIALWNGSKIITGIMMVALALLFACWVAVGEGLRADTGAAAPPFIRTNCQSHSVVSYAPISFASSVLFDIVVLGLTLLKLGAAQLPGSRVGRQVYQDTLIYFVTITGANIIILVIQSLSHDPNMLKTKILPFSTVLTVAMAQRVYLNLKLYHHRRERQLAGLNTTSGGTASHGISTAPRTWLPPTSFSEAARAPSPQPAFSEDTYAGEGYYKETPFGGHELTAMAKERYASGSTAFRSDSTA